MRKKEPIQEIISSHRQKHQNSVDHRFLDVCMFEPLTIHEGQIRGSRRPRKNKKERKKEKTTCLCSAMTKTTTKKNALPQFEEDKEKVQLSDNWTIQLRFGEQNMRNQTNVVEYFENLKKKFPWHLTCRQSGRGWSGSCGTSPRTSCWWWRGSGWRGRWTSRSCRWSRGKDQLLRRSFTLWRKPKRKLEHSTLQLYRGLSEAWIVGAVKW